LVSPSERTSTHTLRFSTPSNSHYSPALIPFPLTAFRKPMPPIAHSILYNPNQQSMPSSPRKIASARANGAKSRGPASASGKQSSAMNALAHGLTARTVVLFNEPADQFQVQLRDYLDHFRPQTKPEDDLVHQLAAAHWRVARYAGVESGLLEQRMYDQEDRYGDELEGQPEHHRIAFAFKALSGDNSSLALLNRYQARLSHEYQRILKTLIQMQTMRAKESNKAKLPNEPNPAPT
jgi:hypothetical protein